MLCSLELVLESCSRLRGFRTIGHTTVLLLGSLLPREAPRLEVEEDEC